MTPDQTEQKIIDDMKKALKINDEIKDVEKLPTSVLLAMLHDKISSINRVNEAQAAPHWPEVVEDDPEICALMEQVKQSCITVMELIGAELDIRIPRRIK